MNNFFFYFDSTNGALVYCIWLIKFLFTRTCQTIWILSEIGKTPLYFRDFSKISLYVLRLANTIRFFYNLKAYLIVILHLYLCLVEILTSILLLNGIKTVNKLHYYSQ